MHCWGLVGVDSLLPLAWFLLSDSYGALVTDPHVPKRPSPNKKRHKTPPTSFLLGMELRVLPARFFLRHPNPPELGEINGVSLPDPNSKVFV